MRNILTTGLLLSILMGCKESESIDNKWVYPSIKPDTTVDVYYGKAVIDPFRNLENIKDSIIQEWFIGQRIYCDSILNNITGKDSLHKEIAQLLYSSNIRSNIPRPAGCKIFFYREYIKEEVEKLFVSDSLAENMVELFSTEGLNKENNSYYSIDYYEPSYDGKYIAFSLSSDGDEKNVVHILNVETKQLLPDKIERAVSGNPQWLPDGSGFFYKQLRKPPVSGSVNFKRLEQSRIRLHILNTNSKNDREIFSKKATPSLAIDNIDFPHLHVSPGSPYVLAALNHGTSPYFKLFVCKLDEVLEKASAEIKWKNIVTFKDKIRNFTIRDNKLFVFSYKSNPNGQLLLIDLENNNQQSILFDRKNMGLNDITQNKEAVYFTASINGLDSLYKINKNLVSNVNLSLDGKYDIRPFFGVAPRYSNSNYLLVGLNSWDKEWGVYYFNDETGTVKKLQSRPSGPYGMPSDLKVTEVEVICHDGEKVPLSIIHREDIKLNGKNQTILYAYGAYGYSLDPGFNVSRLSWYNRGGIYAVAHVRGGGEKGDNWYKGGLKETKPNSWKDFISCAEYLIDNNYTCPGKLAAEGASAGGITIGRAITERPDLFKAAIIEVGRLNTVRHENSSNTANISEYGTVNDSLEFLYLYEMDTYHHIGDGVEYPAMLFTTGMNDPRVAPWQPGKVVARMQALKNSSNPVLFLVGREGHQGDSDSAVQTLNKFSFLFWQLGYPEFIYNGKNSIQ
jgi:prolyl oligopeptidase